MDAKKMAIVAGILLLVYLYLRKSLTTVAAGAQTSYVLPASTSAPTEAQADVASSGTEVYTDSNGTLYTNGPAVEGRSGITHFTGVSTAPPAVPGGTLDDQSATILHTTSGTPYTAGPATEAKSGRGHF